MTDSTKPATRSNRFRWWAGAAAVAATVAVVLVVAELFSQRSVKLKINAGLVLIPLILRALMIG